ncbi:class IV adenylate cyclase [Kitasatospora sp. NPDC001683]
MAIEAELKAVVRDPEGVLKRLDEQHGPGRAEVYRDTYYDTADGSLMDADRELRIRTVHGPDDTRTLLTYKGARVDEASGSKPEAETRVEDAAAMHEIVRGARPRWARWCGSNAWRTSKRRAPRMGGARRMASAFCARWRSGNRRSPRVVGAVLGGGGGGVRRRV